MFSDSDVRVVYIPFDFLSTSSIDYWESGEISRCNAGFVSSSLQFYQFLLYLFWSSVVKGLHIKKCFLKKYVWELSHFSRVWLFETPWTVAHQALSMGFSRQKQWSGLPCPPPGHLPELGIKPQAPCLLHCRQILYHWATREALWIWSVSFYSWYIPCSEVFLS